MSIRAQEEALFAEWRSRHAGFVADGVVDEAGYLRSSPKLLFLLKEVNDLDGGGWDLREFIRDGARWQTWTNIARWTLGIRALPADRKWADVESIGFCDARTREALRSICAMNLKKYPGSHTSNSVEVAAVSAADREFLARQFRLYGAEFAICCGTGRFAHSLALVKNDPQWKQTRRGVWYYEHEPGKFVIDYAHPSARCAANLLYYGLIDAVRELVEHRSSDRT